MSSLLLHLLFLTACNNSTDEPTTFYLLRHAEKDLNDTTDNPLLTEEGKARAQKLVKEMEGVEINGIYSTRFERNIHTVQPLADERALQINTYVWEKWQPMLDTLQKSTGQTYLICGHGNNLLPMIDYLGSKRPLEKLGDHEYDKIFKVTLEQDSSRVEMLTY